VQELFEAGKNRDSYFSTLHVCNQVAHTIEILEIYYIGKDHVFTFNNSPTHKKQGSATPSAQRMLKKMPKPTAKNFLVPTADEEGN
jgi:hypothetical protein